MTVVAVVHGGTIMAIMELLGKGDYFDFQVANSDFIEVDITITETDFYAGKQRIFVDRTSYDCFPAWICAGPLIG